MAAVAHIRVVADRLLQPWRPVDHRRQGLRGRQAQADRRRRHQPLGLHHGVGEVSGANHHRHHARRLYVAVGDELAKRRDDAAGHVRGGRGLDLAQHTLTVHQDGVCIGASDVNTDTG